MLARDTFGALLIDIPNAEHNFSVNNARGPEKNERNFGAIKVIALDPGPMHKMHVRAHKMPTKNVLL